MPLASAIEKQFSHKYTENPEQATEFFYQLSQDSAYIRSDRLAQNLCWKSPTAFGTIEVTINLAKPEKDPKAIAAAAAQPDNGYPQCLLCAENEGYAGHPNWAPRFNHRIVRLQLAGEPFAFQYSPYLYYPQHSILLSLEHRPMAIDRQTFAQLFDFVRQFPHYMVGSNADLPIVGGSILSHHHFQAGCYEFPMFRAPTQPWSEELLPHTLKQGNKDIRAEILNWPLSCIRLSATAPEVANRLWRANTPHLAQLFGSINRAFGPDQRSTQHDYPDCAAYQRRRLSVFSGTAQQPKQRPTPVGDFSSSRRNPPH